MRSTGVGADRQMLNLAAALGGQTRVIDVLDSPMRAVLDRLMPGRSRSIPEPKRCHLAPPWPDLVLFGGGRSLVDAERIRHASGGRARIVCIGRIGARLNRVDLLLSTPQYCLPAHPQIVDLALPLNRIDRATLAAASQHWRGGFTGLPRPWHGVMVGGPSGSFRFDVEVARRLGQQLRALVERHGGSLLITTSPRTSPAVIDAMAGQIQPSSKLPNWLYRWRPDDPDNPLNGILALADDLVVTADSASMLAEACGLGKPVMVFAPPLRLRARLLATSWLPRPLARFWQPWRDRLTAAGLWVPARRMQRIHQALIRDGRILALADAPRACAPPRSLDRPLDLDLDRAVSAVRRMLERD